jgi:AcrR family transcriptional regulator
MPAPGTSVKGDERRRKVLEAAVACFSHKGFYGTTTHEIADRAGISQPYLYRLFDNKQALFASAVHLVSELMASALASTAEASPSLRSPAETLHAARMAYAALIRNHDILMFLMQANCAADEPLVGDAVRQCYAKQVELVRNLFGSDEEAIRQWFRTGMLDNVVIALHLAEINEPWARTLTGSVKLGM